MSFGSSKSNDTSRPLSGQERGDIFNWGLGSINAAMGNYATPQPTESQPGAAGKLKAQIQQGQPGIVGSTRLNIPQYQAPEFTGSGSPQSLSGGDYNRLEQSIVDSRWAPLQRYETQQRERTDEDLNKRGIWSSGIATQAQGDVTEQFAPQYAAAGADAAAQRYGLQAQEQQFMNQLAQQEATRKTGFDADQAAQEYTSQWAPLEYLMGLYNQTGGALSSSKSKGFDFSL